MRSKSAQKMIGDNVDERFELVGSRGRAAKYGRPEPEGKDYDYTAFSDDPIERKELWDYRKQLSKGDGFKHIDRGDQNATASSKDADYNLYSTAKRDRILKAWELQEQGIAKQDAWDVVNRGVHKNKGTFK